MVLGDHGATDQGLSVKNLHLWFISEEVVHVGELAGGFGVTDQSFDISPR